MLKSVPKISGLINARELEIAARVRAVRENIGWAQGEFALALGTSRNQVASIEYGRTPLRYWQADRLCEKFGVCQRWLATGEVPRAGYVKMPIEIGIEIGQRELFSSVHDRRIGHFVKRRIQETELLKQRIASAPGGAEKLFENKLRAMTTIFSGRIEPHLIDDYFGRLMEVSSAFLREQAGQPLLARSGSASGKTKTAIEKDLTEAETYGKLPSNVKEQLPGLLERLNRATKETGKMSALADFLKVPLASVSRWLSGKREPGGEVTLRMLQWLEQQERKQ